MTLNENKIRSKIIEAVKQKRFYEAISSLHNSYGALSADCYNSTLCEFLFHFCIALGVQGAYITKQTYDVLMKLPMYRNLCGQTPFLARTMQIYNKVKNKNYEFDFKKTSKA